MPGSGTRRGSLDPQILWHLHRDDVPILSQALFTLCSTRMHGDPARGVVDEYGRSHDRPGPDQAPGILLHRREMAGERIPVRSAVWRSAIESSAARRVLAPLASIRVSR